MITFLGEYTGKIDDKGRLILPSSFKSMLPSDKCIKLVVKKNLFEDCLDVFTFEEWERQSNVIKSGLNPYNPAHEAFWRKYTRSSSIVDPDPKLGRMLIPKSLLQSIGVDKEVVFSGNDYKIEIWAKEKYESGEISMEEFLGIAEQLSQSR